MAEREGYGSKETLKKNPPAEKMSTVVPRSTRIMPALGQRLLAAPACRASHCTAAGAVAAVSPPATRRGSGVAVLASDRSASISPAASGPGRRSLRANPVAVARKPWDGRRSLHATARNLGVDPVAHGPKGLLPEFSLKDKVIVVSGGAQGLGLVQAEALLEAGATGK